MFMKTIAVGPRLLVESCVTGGATVAMDALHVVSRCMIRGFGLIEVSCKARFASAPDRLAIFAR